MKYIILVPLTALLFQYFTISIHSQETNTYTTPSAELISPEYPCTLPFPESDSIIINLTEFCFPNTTIRALEVINDTTVWFAGSNGYWGYTQNDGKSWHIEQFRIDSIIPEFRSITVTPNGAVFLVSIMKPAAIFKSTDMGKHWNIVYSDSDTNAFFDAVEFWDNKHGIMLGDALNNCFHIALTNDGGNTWNKVNCKNLPQTLTGENPFAASNTNIATYGTHAWFGTGGTTRSRVYHTPDFGNTWSVTESPITSGKTMTGIYSIHFIDENTGIVAGGNWEETEDFDSTMAITEDGGKSWRLITNRLGFNSCVQFIPETNANGLLSLKGRARGGKSSISYSSDAGESWQKIANTNYLGIQFYNSSIAWMSGKEKIARIDFH